MKYTIILVALITITFSMLRDSFIISDEAVNLQMVKNMTFSDELIVRPSYNPGGDLDWKKNSAPLIQMTPVLQYIYLFANRVLPGSLIQTSSIVQSLFLLALVVVIFLFLRDFKRIEHSGVDIFFISFIPLSYLMLLEHEGMLTVCGFLSLCLASRGLEKKSKILLMTSGAFLGLSYLAKLWLVGPFIVGFFAILVNSIIRKEYKISQYPLLMFLVLISFVSVAVSHLYYINIISPEDISTWIDEIYLGLIKNSGGAKDKINNVSYWNQPFYYYFYIFIRDLLGLTPLIVLVILNIKKVWNRFSLNNYNLALVFTFLSFICLSFINTKEPMYILPSLVAFVILLIKAIESIEISDNNDVKKSLFVSIPLFVIFASSALIFKFSNTVNSTFLQFQAISFISSCLYIFLYKVKNIKKSVFFSLLVITLPFTYMLVISERKYQPVIEYINSNKPVGSSPENPYVVADAYSHIGFKIWNKVQKFDWVLGSTYKSLNIKNLVQSNQFKFIVVEKNTKESDTILKIAKELKYKILDFGSLKLIDKSF